MPARSRRASSSPLSGAPWFFQRSPSSFSIKPATWGHWCRRHATSARMSSESAPPSLPTSSRAWSFWFRASQARASTVRLWLFRAAGRMVVRELLSASMACSGLRFIR